MLPQIINFSVSLTLTKVWGNFNIAHCCFPIFELRVWHSPPFSSITFSAFNFPLQVEIEMNCCKNVPENKNRQYFQKKRLYRLNYKNVISFNNEGLGITLFEHTFWMFFSSKSAKIFPCDLWFNRKTLPCICFGQF